MINTISELLKEFVEGEKLALNKYNIKHRPTIGDMYEGLTKEIVNKSIFDGLNLNVSTQSFIEGCDTEFDVILSEGKGESIPYTQSYKFKPSQVIAVIQVKKSLSYQELRNSYDNLRQVAEVFYRNIRAMDASMVDDSFRKICHKKITSYDKGVLNKQEESIYHSLVMDSFFPLRIVLGYNGYKTELGIRNSFVDFLESNTGNTTMPIKGFSPISFPNLIISENYSLIKLTGCPYCVPLGNIREGWWEIMTSSHYNPMHFFLEMLWTKLSYRFHVIPTEVFGDDLIIEPHTKFLRAKIHLNNEEEPDGWEYEYSEISEQSLSMYNSVKDWEPIVVDTMQVQILNELNRHSININDAHELEDFVIKNGYPSLLSIVKSLEKKGFISIEGDEISLLTKQLAFSFSPDGKIYAFDSCDKKMSQWLIKNL
ncbi:MAG: hypothetical protein IK004_08310 [Bacteroidales bacterium]|nr:hypothetical protein [Bacteroidales bacterium]